MHNYNSIVQATYNALISPVYALKYYYDLISPIFVPVLSFTPIFCHVRMPYLDVYCIASLQSFMEMLHSSPFLSYS